LIGVAGVSPRLRNDYAIDQLATPRVRATTTTTASATFHAVGASIATAADATGSSVRVGECGAAITTADCSNSDAEFASLAMRV